MVDEQEVKSKSESLKRLMRPELWVKRSLVFEMPKKLEEYLEDLAKLCDTTCDEILCDELRNCLQNFYQGDYLDRWLVQGIGKRGLSEELGV